MKRRSWSRARKALPTNAELQILDALWTLGEGTVEDVVACLPSSPRANYKTVQSLLRIMEGKRFVRHTTRGRAFVFNSCVTRDEVGGSLTKHLLDRTFQGSCSALMMNLLDSNSVKDQELDELEALIQGYRERKNKDESSKLR
jgi:BlaI family transcriptional regulator, penicillinase repressor